MDSLSDQIKNCGYDASIKLENIAKSLEYLDNLLSLKTQHGESVPNFATIFTIGCVVQGLKVQINATRADLVNDQQIVYRVSTEIDKLTSDKIDAK